MGRRKIRIERLSDDRNRHVTFQKRKAGLIKKAMELSILCDCEVALMIFAEPGLNGTLHEFFSTPPEELLPRYFNSVESPHECFEPEDYDMLDGTRGGRVISSDGGKAGRIVGPSRTRDTRNWNFHSEGHRQQGIPPQFASPSLATPAEFSHPSYNTQSAFTQQVPYVGRPVAHPDLIPSFPLSSSSSSAQERFDRPEIQPEMKRRRRSGRRVTPPSHIDAPTRGSADITVTTGLDSKSEMRDGQSLSSAGYNPEITSASDLPRRPLVVPSPTTSMRPRFPQGQTALPLQQPYTPLTPVYPPYMKVSPASPLPGVNIEDWNLPSSGGKKNVNSQPP